MRTLLVLAILFCTPSLGQEENLIQNGNFSQGTGGWRFFHGERLGGVEVQNGTARLRVEPGANVQFFQSGFSLQPDTEYILYYRIQGNRERSVRIDIRQHASPYTAVSVNTVDIQTARSRTVRVITFRTPLGGDLSNMRLMFWLADGTLPGDLIILDDVALYERRTSDALECYEAPPTGRRTILVWDPYALEGVQWIELRVEWVGEDGNWSGVLEPFARVSADLTESPRLIDILPKPPGPPRVGRFYAFALRQTEEGTEYSAPSNYVCSGFYLPGVR